MMEIKYNFYDHKDSLFAMYNRNIMNMDTQEQRIEESYRCIFEYLAQQKQLPNHIRQSIITGFNNLQAILLQSCDNEKLIDLMHKWIKDYIPEDVNIKLRKNHLYAFENIYKTTKIILKGTKGICTLDYKHDELDIDDKILYADITRWCGGLPHFDKIISAWIIRGIPPRGCFSDREFYYSSLDRVAGIIFFVARKYYDTNNGEFHPIKYNEDEVNLCSLIRKQVLTGKIDNTARITLTIDDIDGEISTGYQIDIKEKEELYKND